MTGRSSNTAGDLIRRARHTAGISQVELARRASIHQSVVSVYESGRRQPGLDTLIALIAATGQELTLNLRPRAIASDELTGRLGRLVVERLAGIERIADRSGVYVVGVFGSVARSQETVDSDIDLLVQLPDDMGFFGLARVESDLEALLGAKVDLVPEDGLKPDIRDSVMRDLVRL